MEAIIIILLAALVAEGFIVILELSHRPSGRQKPAEDEPAEAEKKAKELEKRWNDGIQSILGYSAENAKKAVRDYVEDED